MKIIDIKSLPDLINYYGAHDKDGDGELTSNEVPALIISKYDVRRDGKLLPWEIMNAANRIQGKAIFKHRDIVRLRQSKQSTFPLHIRLSRDTKVRGIRYRKGSVFIGKYGKVAYGVLAHRTKIQGHSLPAGTKVFFYSHGTLRGARTPTDTELTFGAQRITVKEGTVTEFHSPEGRIKSATLAKETTFSFKKNTATFPAGSRIPFRNNTLGAPDIVTMLNDSIALLSSKSTRKHLKGLRSLTGLIRTVGIKTLDERIDDRTWVAMYAKLARFAQRTLERRKPPARTILIETLAALSLMGSSDSVTWKHENLQSKAVRLGLQKYPLRTIMAANDGKILILQEFNHRYIERRLIPHRDPEIRLAALRFIVKKDRQEDAERAVGFLSKRLKVERNARVLTRVIMMLTTLPKNKDVRKLLPQLRRMGSDETKDSTIRFAAIQCAQTIITRMNEEKARAERRRKKALKLVQLQREALEKILLKGWFSGGFSAGFMASHDRLFKTFGIAARGHASLNKGIWLSENNKYMLSTGIEVNVDPLMAHWAHGWYSIGLGASLRLNLSKTSNHRREHWRIFVGPGFAMRYTPKHEHKHPLMGFSISAGLLVDGHDYKLRETTFMIGPELTVRHYPRTKESFYFFSFKLAWQPKR